jgi:hypothetical protein
MLSHKHDPLVLTSWHAVPQARPGALRGQHAADLRRGGQGRTQVRQSWPVLRTLATHMETHTDADTRPWVQTGCWLLHPVVCSWWCGARIAIFVESARRSRCGVCLWLCVCVCVWYPHRDWNEDYQSLRESPVRDANDKVFRAKVLHKVSSLTPHTSFKLTHSRTQMDV